MKINYKHHFFCKKLSLVLILILLVFVSSCKAKKIDSKERIEIKKDSIVQKIDKVKIAVEKVKEVKVYKGVKDSFSVPADSTGRIPEFEKEFDTGNVKGTIGFSKEKGSYYKIETKDVIETDTKKVVDSTKKTIVDSKVVNETKSEKSTTITKYKWSTFNWITFVISLLLLLFLIYRLYKTFSSPGGWLTKIKSIFNS